MTTAPALRRMLTTLAFITITLMAVAAPVVTLAAAQDVTQSAAEPTAMPTATLAPTSTPIPTIAPTPTPIPPTPTPVPTDVPTPTPVPTELPTATATIAPTATSESPPPTEPVPTATSTATATPEPTATPAPDAITCDDLVGTRSGSTWQFDGQCVYTINSARSETRVQVTVAATDVPGWTVQLRPTGGDWTAAGTTAELVDARGETGTTISFDVRVIAPATATAGQRATIAISTQIVNSEDVIDGPGTTLDATIPNTVTRQTVGVTSIVSQAQPSVLSCTQPNGDTVLPGQTLAYACQFSVTYQNPGKVNTTFTASIGSGWDIGLTSSFGVNSTMDGDGTAQLLVPSNNGTLTGTVTVSVKAPATAVPGSTGSLALASTCDKAQACPTSAQKGSVTITTTVIAPAQCKVSGADRVTASLTSGTLPPVPFSYQSRTNSGTMTLTVQNPTMCTGWNVDVSATPLVYTGAAPGQPSIPASNLQLSGAGVATVQLSSTAQRLVANGSTNTTYTYPLTVSLIIPAGAPAGVYTSTLTVTTTSAP